MRIHTDKLTRPDFGAASSRALPGDVYYEIMEHGSRSHARAFELSMDAEPGCDRHGIKRAYSRNTGKRGGEGGPYKAATWVEWGDFIAELFRLDPYATIGPYLNAAHFIELTTNDAKRRPARENAKDHAERWANELSNAVETAKLRLCIQQIAQGIPTDDEWQSSADFMESTASAIDRLGFGGLRPKHYDW